MAPPAIGFATALLLLWLAGNALRLTILAVPPVIPLIHLDLSLSKTQVGILSGIPMVLFAGAAIAGSVLISRFGAVRTLIAGLLLCAIGGALRGIGPNIWMLYAMTVVMAFGVAVMQPSLPPLVRAWVPQRMGFATAVYTNGLIIGEILPAALTIPLVLPMLHQSWPWTFVFWSVPVVIIAAIIAYAAPGTPASAPTAASRRWMPDFRSPQIWRIGLLLGSVNASYFALNGFLPDYLTHTGRPDLINAALTALNTRPVARLLPVARLGRPDGADRLVLPRVRRRLPDVRAGDAARRHLGGDRCRRVGLLRRRGTGACPRAAAADQPARGRASRLRRHVHHQLLLRGDRADHQRRYSGT